MMMDRWVQPAVPNDPSSASGRAAGRCCWPTLEVDGVGGAGGAEVADVDALGPTDADPAHERVVHVAEERVSRLDAADHVEQRGRPGLHPAGHRVVEQLRDGGRYVRADDVDRADRVQLGGELWLRDLVGGAIRGDQPGSGESAR